MSHDVTIDGLVYISSKRASELTGYTQDYVGQLARSGKVMARRVGGLWYVLQESLLGHKEVADAYTPTPPPISESKVMGIEESGLVTFDGKSYVSASRAAKLTSYHQDYIGQLARSGKVLSHQVGNRWYVDIDGLKAHKTEKDALLGAVQSEAVGLRRPEVVIASPPEIPEVSTLDTHFQYTTEAQPLIPPLQERIEELQELPIEEEEDSTTHVIPIRVVRTEERRIQLEEQDALREVVKAETLFKVEKPGMSIFYKVFAVVLIMLTVVIAYNVQLFRASTLITKNTVSSETLSVAMNMFSFEGSLGSRLRWLFSKTLVFERGD